MSVPNALVNRGNFLLTDEYLDYLLSVKGRNP